MVKDELLQLKYLLPYIANQLELVSDAPWIESRMIVKRATGISEEQLYSFDDSFSLSKGLLKKTLSLVQERKKGIPIFYLLGMKEFMGLEFEVNRSVLIPRPETETLVEEALSIADKRPLNVLDIGTGSGCIILSFLKYNTSSHGTAIDVSKDALLVAKKNALRLGFSGRLKFAAVDFRKFTSNEKFDMVFSNPPYIKSARVSLLQGEPRVALDGGEDGKRIYYDLIAKAFELLGDEGFFIVEIDEDMGVFVADMFIKTGFKNTGIMKDLAGKDRFVSGTK